MDSTSSSKQRRQRSPPILLATAGVMGLPSPSPISRMDRFSTNSTTRSPLNRTVISKDVLHNDQTTGTAIEPSNAYSEYYTPQISSTEPSSRLALLSPSRTISETLMSLATVTGRQLEAIWDEVGYSPDERSAELSDLTTKLREICEMKIASEQRLADTYRQTILEGKEEIQKIANALQVDINPRITNSKPTQTLIDEHAALETELEALRIAAETAKADMQDCLNFLLEAHDALGVPLDPSWCDIESNLTTRRREQFHLKVNEMKEELLSRTAAVVKLVRDCQQLMEDLHMDVERDGSELDRRIVGSLIRSEDGTCSLVSQKRSATCVGINSKALDELTRHVAKLHGEKRRRKAMLQEMGAEIAVLWEKLHIDDDEQMAFTQSVKGLSLETIIKGENELMRLRALKAKMLGNLIKEARETIHQLWELTNVKEEDRRNFTAFNIRDETLMDDDLLEKHEAYIETLQLRMDQMRPILRLIERREVIVQERIQYEDLQKDPERLTTRGAASTKQLMAEERMAIRIKRDLPKLTEKLTETLNEWKVVHQEDFQYKGEVYIQIMARQEEEWKNYKADEAYRKLKKKQEEMNFVENRFVGQPNKRRLGGTTSQPLSDNTSSQNIASSSTSTAVITELKPPINASTQQVPSGSNRTTNHSIEGNSNGILMVEQSQQGQKRSLLR